MNFRRMAAVLKKQLKDTVKNKTVLIQFLMFPLITVIMQNSVNLEGMPPHFFVVLFGTMYVGMAPLTVMAAIISEEKEKNTLRVLLMSNVKAGEYLIGVSLYVFCLCLAGTLVIGIEGGYEPDALGCFMAVSALGIIITTLIGAAVGAAAGNQMEATSLSVPLMLVLAFFPMLSYFNDGIGRISKFIYTQQIFNWLDTVDHFSPGGNQVIVVIVNAAVAGVLFFIFMKKRGLEA